MKIRKYGVVLTSMVLLFGCATHTPAPVTSINKDYSQVERGSYRGSYYEVKKGDTLYFIAYLTDKDVNDLIRFNGLSKPYTIYPGQKLKLWQAQYVAPNLKHKANSPEAPEISVPVVTLPPPVVTPPTPKPSVSSTDSAKKTAKTEPKTPKKEPVKKVEQSKPKEYVEPKGKDNVKTATAPTKPKNDKISKWLWPTKGRVVKNFSAGEQGNKGIDIAGQRGQAIIATAAGTVVYSGDALRGYGNLIIVKHNDKFLSAYAHNERLLVSEGQKVKAGQKIATMGSSGTKSVRLHFEIRYQGKSVNPKRYLP